MELAYVGYFVVLLLAPVAIPPVVAEGLTSVSYAEATIWVSAGVAFGYLCGMAALLRPV